MKKCLNKKNVDSAHMKELMKTTAKTRRERILKSDLKIADLQAEYPALKFQEWVNMIKISYCFYYYNFILYCINLLRMAGWFIDQRHKEQEKIISITVANKKVVLMQMWAESTHWLLLKQETIPTKHLINRKGDIGIFLSLQAYVVRKVPSWKG